MMEENVHYARFLTDEEMIKRKTIKEVHFYTKGATGSGVPIHYDYDKYYVNDDEEEHSLVIGSTGSGKSQYLVLFQLYSAALSGRSCIIYDPKGEHYAQTYHLFLENDFNIKVLNLHECSRGSAYNPLKLATDAYFSGDESRAVQQVSDVFSQLASRVRSQKDQYWESALVSCLTGTFLLLCEIGTPKEDITIENCLRCFNDGIAPVNNELGVASLKEESLFTRYYKTLKKKGLELQPSFDKIRAIDNTASETKASVMGVLNEAVSGLLGNADLLQMMTNHDVDIQKMVEEKTVLFIIGSHNSDFYKDVISIILSQIQNELIRIGDSMPDRRLPRRVDFVLDEFASGLYIQNLQQILTTCRSYRIRYSIFIQSKKQLDHIYGEKVASTIMDNTALYYLHSSDPDLHELISRRCGKSIAPFSGEVRPLVSTVSLNRIRNKGEFIYIARDCNPYICHMKPYYACKTLHGKTASLSDIPKRIDKKRPAFSLAAYMNKMEMKESVEVYCNPFFSCNPKDEMFLKIADLPLSIEGYHLFDFVNKKIITNRIDTEDAYTQLIAMFQIEKRHFLAFRCNMSIPFESMEEEDEYSILFCEFNPKFRFSALKSLSTKEETMVRKLFAEIMEERMKREYEEECEQEGEW